MNHSLSASPPKFKLVRLYWIGLILFAVTCGPQLLYGLLAGWGYIDRAANPRLTFWVFMPAMMAFFPSMICMAVGIIQSVMQFSQARKHFQNPGLESLSSNTSGPPRFKFGSVFWIGLIIFVGCSGPLLLTLTAAKLGLTSDPNPNPVMFGMMAMLSFWPSIFCIIGGITEAIFRHRKAKQLYAASR